MKAYLIAITLLIVIFEPIGAYLMQRFSVFSEMDLTPPPVTVAVSTQDAGVVWCVILFTLD